MGFEVWLTPWQFQTSAIGRDPPARNVLPKCRPQRQQETSFTQLAVIPDPCDSHWTAAGQDQFAESKVPHLAVTRLVAPSVILSGMAEQTNTLPNCNPVIATITIMFR